MCYWNPGLSFACGLNPLDVDVLKFAEDVNEYDLVDVYGKNCVDNFDIIYETELAHEYDEEVQVNDGPNSDNDNVVDDEERNNKAIRDGNNGVYDEGWNNKGIEDCDNEVDYEGEYKKGVEDGDN